MSRIILILVLGLSALLILAGAAVLPGLLRSDVVTYEWAGEMGTGTLVQPIGVTYLDGRLYVSDAGANRIVVFDTVGALLDEWDGGEEGLQRPMHLHLGRDGRLHVPEYLADRVTVLDVFGGDEPGRVVERIGGRTGSGPGALDAPGGVSVFGDRVLIADFYNHRVQSFGPEGPEVLGRPGRVRATRMNYPTDVAASDSLIYVADAYNHRIQVFRPDGRYAGRWGGPLGLGIPGGLKGWFRVATGVHVFGDTVYVADFYNHRVQVFGAGGRYLGQAADSLNLPTAAARGGRGEIYVADFGNARIVRFTPSLEGGEQGADPGP